MMFEIAVSVIFVAQCCIIAFLAYNGSKEREKLLKLLMAKSLQEVTDNEIIQKRPQAQEETPADVVEITPDDETIFDKMIREQTHGPTTGPVEEL